MARGSAGPDIVVTRTPLRISFAGGGTDLSEFYQVEEGAVFSSAIDKYIYVTVKYHSEVFNERIRLNYSKSEQVQSIDEIENDIARESLRLLEVDPPIYISTVADLPASSGMGSSSSFAVGLLNALHAFKGERVSAGQLAEEACYIEIDVLGRPIGKQDQYAAAFGGLNVFSFRPDGRVSVEPQRVTNGTLRELFRHTLLFWTGRQRDAAAVLVEQRDNVGRKLDDLRAMRCHAYELRELMYGHDFDAQQFGSVLDATWQRKRDLSSSITLPEIDEWYARAIRAGAEGGKLCGAGGGGFLLFVVRPDRQAAVRKALCELVEVPVGCEVHGSQVLFTSNS